MTQLAHSRNPAFRVARYRLKRGRPEFCAEDTQHPASPEMVQAVGLARLRPPEAYAGLLGQLRRALDRAHAPPPRVCPWLMLRGEHDRVATAPDASMLAEAAPPSRAETLADAGHVLYAADAGPVAERILGFLGDCGVVNFPCARR